MPHEEMGKQQEVLALDEEMVRVLKGIFTGLAPGARAATIKKKIDIFVRNGVLPETALAEVDRLSQETDEQAFVDGIKALAAPMLALHVKDPLRYEALSREQILEAEKGWNAVNQLVAYEDLSDNWRLHILPNQHTPNAEKTKLLRQALKELAARIKERPEIIRLDGTSWIVPRATRFLQKLGFEIVGEIPEELRQAHFASESREVQRATMSREMLLEKYGKEEGE